MDKTTSSKRVPSFLCETRTWSIIDEKEARSTVDRVMAPGSPAPTLEPSEPWKLSDPTLIRQDEPSPLDPEKLRDAMEKERQRVKQTSDDLAYQGSARRLRLAARNFINPRGRFEDLRPEINEILRRKYPATEERLSCPPAPLPSVSAAEETSSGEGRCTAKGAGSCCKDMKFSLEDGYLYRERGYVVMVVEMGAKRRGFIRIDFCPWCGTKLEKET